MLSKSVSTIEDASELPIAFRTRAGGKRRLEMAEARMQAKHARLDLSIDQLPNEMLLEIFSWMDQETLKQSSLVSRKWDGIISKTSETMKNLPLKINGVHLSFMQDIKLKRRYQEATLSGISFYSAQLLQELKGIGGTIVKLNLINCEFHSNDIQKLLACFPFVVTLAMRWCNDSLMAHVIFPIELGHLKKLKVVGTAWMLDYIKCNVKDFAASRIEDGQDQLALFDFLNSQTSLETLDLDCIEDLYDVFQRDEPIVMDLKFQLRELSLNALPYANIAQLLILLTHAEKCSTVNIGFEVLPIVTKHVLKNFHNLEYLFIDAAALPMDSSFYIGLKPNKQLKSLGIDGFLGTAQPLIDLLAHYPNVETLDLYRLSGPSHTQLGMWSQISAMMPKVSSLKFKLCHHFGLDQIKFPLMKDCEMLQLNKSKMAHWRAFNRNNPNLQTLTIQRSTNCDLNNIGAVWKQMKNLMHLEFSILTNSNYAVLHR